SRMRRGILLHQARGRASTTGGHSELGLGLMSLLVPKVENHIGDTSPTGTPNNSPVLTDSLSAFNWTQRRLNHGGFYQGLAQSLVKGLHTKQSLLDFISKVTRAADQAYSTRQYDKIGALSKILLSLPLSPQIECIGHFYEALSVMRSGHGDTVRGTALFKQVAEHGPIHYRTRAMLALGATSVSIGDSSAALPWYGEIVRIAARERAIDPGTLYFARQMTAIVRASNGDHEGAIRDLEEISPLARLATYREPRAYSIHLNSLAVELAEVGRLEEAARASSIACSSPYASAYPEWQETFDEIALKRRSASRSTIIVSGFLTQAAEGSHRRRVTQISQQLLVDPQERVSLQPSRSSAIVASRYDRPQGSQARVLDFQQWKRRVKPGPGQLSALSAEQRMEMSTGEKLIRLMDLISDDETDDETIDVILEAVEAIVLGRKGAN